MATSFCGPHEGELLEAIERLLRKRIPAGRDQPPATVLTEADRQEEREARQNDGSRRGSGRGGRSGRSEQAGGASANNSRKRPEFMRAKKAKTPSKSSLVEAMLIRKGRNKPKPKPSHFVDPSPCLQS